MNVSYIFICIVVIVNCFAYNNAKYQNKLGYCEPLTIEFIAELITKEVKQLIDPGLQNNNKRVRYDLYTRANPYERQILSTGERDALLRSNFNVAWPVRISLHGWNGQTTTCSNAAIKDAYLSRGDYNVILADWSDYSLDINYFRVVKQVYDIAKQLHEFTRFLHYVTGVQYEHIYLIGHSLGCHIAGVTGKLLKPDMYGAIFALDTSGPIHRNLPNALRLLPTDALYVESIQTDIGLLGFPAAIIGQASFFPNWGLGQPHCPNATTTVPDVVCDHFGSVYYFVESLKNEKAFGAIKCKDYRSIQNQACNCGQSRCEAQVYMGGDPAVSKQGIYYLSTRKTEPFGYGEMCRIKRALSPTVARLN